jgi:hypothetical protein
MLALFMPCILKHGMEVVPKAPKLQWVPKWNVETKFDMECTRRSKINVLYQLHKRAFPNEQGPSISKALSIGSQSAAPESHAPPH